MIYIATMQTEHFTFQALGASSEAARKASLRGWLRHLGGLGDGGRRTLAELEDWYGINVTALEMNDCARDGEVLGVA